MIKSITTLENGDVSVTTEGFDGFETISVERTYTVRRGRVHVLFPNGSTVEACEGLKPTGYFIDMPAGASLEAVIRAHA